MVDNENVDRGKKVSLKIAETNPKFVGRGVALIDPRFTDKLQ